MHSSLDQLASDAEGDEIFVHAHIYRHTPTANLFHKAFTQFEGGGFDLCVQLSSLHGLFDAIHDLGALPLIPLHTYQPANRQYGEVLKVIMRVQVNGVRLFFEIEGTKLRLTENSFVEVPTLLLLHGGPGADHSGYRPAFSALSDIAQIVYLDHRGNGRSDHGPKESWNINQWADDVKAFCDALEIKQPIVYGASFGGVVAMAYATRHPTHPLALALVSTTAQAHSHIDAKIAMFSRLGGQEAGELAHRRFVLGDTSPEVMEAWLKIALPLYKQKNQDPGAMERVVMNREATAWFNRHGGEGREFDMLAEIPNIQCPTLILGGQLDPMLPVECQRDIANALDPRLLSYREFEDCGHGVIPDVPELALPLLRDFIKNQSNPEARST